MKPLNRQNTGKTSPRPLKIVQFGTGNFLRGFADWMVQVLNDQAEFNGDIQMVQVHSRKPARIINEQEGLYHVIVRGFQKGETVEENQLIDCVRGAINPYIDYKGFLELANSPELAFIFSNTTEAGIYFEEKDRDWTITPESFPGKLTALLFQRFRHFEGDPDKGLLILPCELIADNGQKLKENVLRYVDLWNLPGTFEDWLVKYNTFCNTLVDRIVPGFPIDAAEKIQENLGYRDDQMVMAEPFHFWAIDGPDELKEKFPADKQGLNVKFVADLTPFRTRKVRILNGAHTSLVPVAYLKGIRLVKEAMDDSGTSDFIEQTIFKEIIPSMDLPEDILKPFAEAVLDRFRNPFIKHKLSDIALNSISKWKVRVLPSLLDFIRKENRLPQHLCEAFAALIVFYRGHYKGEKIPLKDKEEILHYFDQIWKIKSSEEVVAGVLSKIEFWDQDLNLIPGLSQALIREVDLLLEKE
ncbi:tagaturonate reductase [Cyclobacterium plantarum]|uniref:Tagaturonate reductase n=1 Tax=Cyclobacterium plantarum TaxID=2716263 RepID=A0ABX0HD39_9BACT|nr:tagaturonate reductase [Cyclobacterium plantarum]NHE58249.1 tagaturonate reductase [Cyclobacterium plantarum]